MHKEIYYIGGSPCSGKSTIAEQLSNEYGLYYFKVDDFLDKYLKQAAKDGFQLAPNLLEVTSDGMWLRDPVVLCRDEVAYYKYVFQYIRQDINNIQTTQPVIAEGAAFMPEIAKEIGIAPNRYICIVPDENFQKEMYAQRSWVPVFLKDNSDPEAAFANWMDRDQLFAKHVAKTAEQLNYKTLVTTKSTSLENNIKIVKQVFGFTE